MRARIFAEENKRWWTLGALCFALFMIMLDNTVVNVALPAIKSDLGITQSELEWTVAAYALTFASASRAEIAGAANPEKIGTWIAPRCAHACEAIATSGDIGRKSATRSPASTPSAASVSARRVTSPESSR